MKAHLFWLACVVGSLPAADASEISCRVQPLKMEQMTEPLLRAWLHKNGAQLQSIEDLVCCLPDALRDSPVIGHSSIAAQNGVPKAPRVILFSGGSANFVAATINGGNHPALNQTENIEFALLNPTTKHLEYFDLEKQLAGQFRFSEKNPASCLSCHQSGDQTEKVGAKPLFDSFGRWNRFVGGRSPFCSEAERDYYHKVDAAAQTAFTEITRFRCLNKSPSLENKPLDLQRPTHPEMFRRLTLLDVQLNQINHERVARILQLESAFKKLKSNLLGLALCGGLLEDWLPAEVLNQIKGEKFLPKNWRGPLGEDQWKSLVHENVQKKARNLQLLTEEIKKQTVSNLLPLDKGIEPAPLSELRCESQKNDLESQLIKAHFSVANSDLKITWSPELKNTFRKYNLQSSLKGIKGDLPLKMILSALGVDTNEWQMSATGDGTMTPLKPLAKALRNEWSENKNWKAELERFFQHQASAAHSTNLAFILHSGSLVPKDAESCDEFRQHLQSARTPNSMKKASKRK